MFKIFKNNEHQSQNKEKKKTRLFCGGNMLLCANCQIALCHLAPRKAIWLEAIRQETVKSVMVFIKIILKADDD